MKPFSLFFRRKGSLKGRKWMSIFNIGSRFHDPLRRQKHSVKGITTYMSGMYHLCLCTSHLHLQHFLFVSEKERNSLRPARSMDSLSTPSYPNEGAFMYFPTFLTWIIEKKVHSVKAKCTYWYARSSLRCFFCCHFMMKSDFYKVMEIYECSLLLSDVLQQLTECTDNWVLPTS